jgi:hypothetical protein
MPKPEQLSVDAATFEAWERAPYPLHVRGGVQHYPWGSTDAIPELLGQANPKREPFAELWLGAHPDLPAHAIIGRNEIALNRLTGAAGPVLLGETTFEQFDCRYKRIRTQSRLNPGSRARIMPGSISTIPSATTGTISTSQS